MDDDVSLTGPSPGIDNPPSKRPSFEDLYPDSVRLELPNLPSRYKYQNEQAQVYRRTLEEYVIRDHDKIDQARAHLIFEAAMTYRRLLKDYADHRDIEDRDLFAKLSLEKRLDRIDRFADREKHLLRQLAAAVEKLKLKEHKSKTAALPYFEPRVPKASPKAIESSPALDAPAGRIGGLDANEELADK